MSNYRPNQGFDRKGSDSQFDSFSNSPINNSAKDSSGPDYGDTVSYRPQYVSSDTPDDQGYIGGMSTAYSGPKVGILPPSQNNSLGPRVYRPNESTAFQGSRGGYVYGNKLLHDEEEKKAEQEKIKQEQEAAQAQNNQAPDQSSGDTAAAGYPDVESYDAGAYPEGAYPEGYPEGAYPPPSGYESNIDFSPQETKKSPLSFLQNKKVQIGIAAGSAVVVLIGLITFLVWPSGNEPADVVNQYFLDLKNGDADKALSLGKNAPSNTTFLTNDVLKSQNQTHQLKDIHITSTSVNGDTAKVSYQLNYDGVGSVDGSLTTVKDGDNWKLDKPAVEVKKDLFIKASDVNGPKILQLWGKSLPDDSGSDAWYFFPGPISVSLAQSTPALKLGDPTVFLKPDFPATEFPQLSLAIDTKYYKDGGHAYFAVERLFQSCLTQHALHPAPCPFFLDRRVYKEGTANWSFPEKVHNFLPIAWDFGDGKTKRPFASQILFSGSVVVPWKADLIHPKDKIHKTSGKTRYRFKGVIDLTTQRNLKKPEAIFTK